MRALNLTVVAYRGAPCPPQSRRIEAGRLTIGRGEESQWELPDPERELSRIHCIVERVGDGCTISDVSTNGVYLNGASEPLGRNVSAPLADGDEIAIGEYRIRVELEADAVMPSAPAAPDPFAAVPPGSNLSWVSPVSPWAEPFPAASPLSGNPWPQAATDPADPFAAANAPSEREPVGGGFGWLGGGSFEAPLPAFPDQQQAPLPPPPSAARVGLPDPDHVPAIHAHFQPPEIRAPLIPPDWNPLDPQSEPSSASAAPPRAPAFAPEAPPPAAIFASVAPGELAPAVGAPPPRPAAPPPASPPPAPTPPAPTPQPPGHIPGTSAPRPTVAPAEALRAFFDGAGIPDAVSAASDDLRRLREFGEQFREMAAGLRDLVNARAMTKSGLRLPQTAIAAQNNNPFKFSVDLEQLLTALLAPNRPGYSRPVPAIRQAIDDLKEHDLALIAATQQALAAVLAELAPEVLQRHAENAGVLANVLPGARKAAWWDAFEQAYRRAAEGVEADLPGGFQRLFAEAYGEQVRKL
jgi:type VI secretion system protein